MIEKSGLDITTSSLDRIYVGLGSTYAGSELWLETARYCLDTFFNGVDISVITKNPVRESVCHEIGGVRREVLGLDKYVINSNVDRSALYGMVLASEDFERGLLKIFSIDRLHVLSSREIFELSEVSAVYLGPSPMMYCNDDGSVMYVVGFQLPRAL